MGREPSLFMKWRMGDVVWLSSAVPIRSLSCARTLVLIGVFVISLLEIILPFKQRLVFGRMVWHVSLLASKSGFIRRVFVDEVDARWMR